MSGQPHASVIHRKEALPTYPRRFPLHTVEVEPGLAPNPHHVVEPGLHSMVLPPLLDTPNNKFKTNKFKKMFKKNKFKKKKK
mmetsp:Transcript_23343/g.38114  ORF Transcript_23343/g.38114 Transcript_23343/m.38114 type:complete len:82 (-) Transcript_23343:60-305(-)